jgi:hypothetical protein
MCCDGGDGALLSLNEVACNGMVVDASGGCYVAAQLLETSEEAADLVMIFSL